MATPKLQEIARVEITALDGIPDWALQKAVAGLEVTATSVWLRRIAARSLERLDRSAGGTPRLSFTTYRVCRVCHRARLGPDAEARLELDRKWEGWRIPCGPECVEIEAARRGGKHEGLDSDLRSLASGEPVRRRNRRASGETRAGG